jgi:ATP-binding cassette subfamily F protein 3
LFLDEPTNHLDIPAAEILEEALVDFDGTLLFVSHDRRFLENVATRVLSVRDGVVELFNGGFRDYIATHAIAASSAAAEREEEKKRVAQTKASNRPPPPGETKPEARASKQTYEDQKQLARDKEKRKRRIAELENSIALGEAELEVMREALKADPAGDWSKLAEMAEREQDLARKVDAMMAEWTKLSEQEAGT